MSKNTNKILMASVLAITFVLAGNAYAVGQNSDAGTGNQVGQQTQTANQGETSQIKTQNSEQVQNGTGNLTETGNQVQNQNQVKNQGETNQIQNNEQSGTQTGFAVAQQRRSEVANAVQEMLRVAERNGGIGQQVKIIAQNQNQNQEKLEESLAKVQSRGGFARFLIGVNYGEINNAQKILEQNKEQIEQLNQVKNQLTNQSDIQNLTQQIQTLEQANLEIENSLGTAQKGFSLFGWMFRMFSD